MHSSLVEIVAFQATAAAAATATPGTSTTKNHAYYLQQSPRNSNKIALFPIPLLWEQVEKYE